MNRLTVALLVIGMAAPQPALAASFWTKVTGVWDCGTGWGKAEMAWSGEGGQHASPIAHGAQQWDVKVCNRDEKATAMAQAFTASAVESNASAQTIEVAPGQCSGAMSVYGLNAMAAKEGGAWSGYVCTRRSR